MSITHRLFCGPSMHHRASTRAFLRKIGYLTANMLSPDMALTMRRGDELDAALRDGARRQRLLLSADLVDHLCVAHGE